MEFSIRSYCDSLISNFRNHAGCIEDYRKKLKELAYDKRMLLSFYIEDTTAIGNYMSVNGKMEALNPLRIPEFVEELASTQGLDYVVIRTTDLYVPSIRIQRITNALLSELSEKYYGPDDKFIQYHYTRESHFWE